MEGGADAQLGETYPSNFERILDLKYVHGRMGIKSGRLNWKTSRDMLSSPQNKWYNSTVEIVDHQATGPHGLFT